MKNKIIAICLVLSLCLTFCGCQLARPDGYEVSRDRLIGCFITTEHLDLFDFEAYFNDNANKLISGGNIVPDGDTSAYQGRIYAELVTETLTNEDGGSYEYSEYVFTDLEGISLFAPTVADGEDSYITSVADAPVNDVNFGSKSLNYGAGKNEVQGIELEGTVYIPDHGGLVKFFMNPVYQSADGSVYLSAGQGLSFDSEVSGAAAFMLNDEQSQSVNGKEELSYTCNVKMNFESVAKPYLLRVIEMDARSNVIKSVEIIPDELPDEYEPMGDTAYLLLETFTTDDEGEGLISRSIAERSGEEDDITVFVPVENGYLVKAVCEVKWD